MKRFLCAGLLAGLCCASAAEAGTRSAPAPSWMFRRSFYSHQPVHEVRVGAAPRGGPRYTRGRGGYYQGGYRYLRSNIVIGGQVFDSFNVVESWGETGEKY